MIHLQRGGNIIFQNRDHAAYELGKELLKRHLVNPIVLGIPRGGVPMARNIARELNSEFDILLVHKIGHPNHPEFAVGAVNEMGEYFIGDGGKQLGLTEADLKEAAQVELKELVRRRQFYSPGRAAFDAHNLLNLQNRSVIIVDDGIATGATMLAAVRSLRGSGASEIIVAVPVISREALKRFKAEGGIEVVYLKVPPVFYAVSQFYEEFPQVQDQDVISALSQTFVDRAHWPTR
jgi:predicted phosphoribosyltransferase